MKSKARMLATALVTGLAMTAGAQAAAAQSTPPRDAPPASPGAYAGRPVPLYDSAPGGPDGYEVVESGALSDWAQLQTHDEVVCPAGKVPVGGGAQMLSNSLGENLAGSYPTTAGWAVDVNNTTNADGVFDIYAVCANPKGYAVIDYGPFFARAGHQGGADDGCVKGTKLLGGGARITSTADVNVGINETFPSITGHWATYMANAGAQDAEFFQYAIGGEVKHSYRVVMGTTSIDRAGTREQLNAYCPAGTRPLGGGVKADSLDTGVTLNSTFPWPTGWSAIENNTSAADSTITDYVVCE